MFKQNIVGNIGFAVINESDFVIKSIDIGLV